MLEKYKAKRDLKKSKEPKAALGSSKTQFCVQKHAARRLHYDLRLEYKGALLSFAVPKGLSMDPKDKRLAIHVEDHPHDYQYFEGVIPKGNYGAGTVEIWDKGMYTVPEEIDHDKYLAAGLKKGHFTIIFHGDKLEGAFNFVRMHQGEEWLIIKKDDAFKKEELKKKDKMPDSLKPMLATLVPEPFNDPDWIFEIKWDGYRALSYIKNGKVKIKSRSNLSWNDKYPSIVRSLEKINEDVILDGEIVVLDEEGKSHFQALQHYEKGNLSYYVFDILYKGQQDLRGLPLIERKEILKEFLAHQKLQNVLFSDHIVKNGKEFFLAASERNLEGIIGKKLSSSYQSKRSSDWVKIKAHSRQEVVIGGFTEPKGSRKRFGALLTGVYNDKKELIYNGNVGGGFDGAALDEIYRQMKPLIQKKSPFKNLEKAKATWVRPTILAEVSFTERTKEGLMRHPVFKGLRNDKKANEVYVETPSFTNPEKIYWPKGKHTKSDLIAYYETVGKVMLPYLKNRPIMLHRFPDGIKGNSFYQKDIASHPDFIKTFPITSEGKTIHYLLINDLKSLLYAANLGSIDIHPFMATIDDLDHPDYCVIDLDPHEVPFKRVIEAALMLHELLDAWKVKHFCKTSGNKGLHIFIPLQKKYDFTQSRQLAELIGLQLHKKLPRFTSLERDPKKRPKKIYIDCLQNRKSQTIVAPYSLRPNPHAGVSTPLSWDEVNEDLDPSQFTIDTVPLRIKEKGDLFKSILKTGIDIKKILDKVR